MSEKKKITHKTAILTISKLRRLKIDWVDKRVDIVTTYINQQEKQEKLLGLYKELSFKRLLLTCEFEHEHQIRLMNKVDKILEQIKELEK